MTDIRSLLARVQSIKDAATDLGFFNPHVSLNMGYLNSADFYVEVWVYSKPGYGSAPTHYGGAAGSDDPGELLDLVRDWLNNLESPDQVRKRALLQKLSDVMVEATDIGIELPFDFTQFETNLLTYHLAA